MKLGDLLVAPQTDTCEMASYSGSESLLAVRLGLSDRSFASWATGLSSGFAAIVVSSLLP